MVPITATEIVEPRGPSRARALAVVGVLLLAAAGQLALERARANRARPPVFAAIAFAAAAGLAIAAFRRSDLLPGNPRPLELPRYPPALYAACLPGATLLLLALLVHLGASDGDSRPAKLWLLGLVLLLLPGLWDWLESPSRRTPAEKLERRRFVAAAVVLFAFAFAIRIWGGIDRIPGWLDSDEAKPVSTGGHLSPRGCRRSSVSGTWAIPT